MRPRKKTKNLQSSRPLEGATMRAAENISAQPKIQDIVLRKFLESKVDMKEITDIRCCYLWSRGDVERYRINLYVETWHEAALYPKKSIGHSFFVHYDRYEEEIIDKTIITKEVSNENND